MTIDRNKGFFGWGVLLITFCFSTFGFAQSKYNIQKINSNNGLGSNYISDIFLDQNKVLWIATQGGLYLYDGKNMLKSYAVLGSSSRFILLQRGSDKFDVDVYNTSSKITFRDYSTISEEQIRYNYSFIYRDIHGGFLFDPLFNIDSFQKVIEHNNIDLFLFDGTPNIYIGTKLDGKLILVGRSSFYIFDNESIRSTNIEDVNYYRELLNRSNVFHSKDDCKSNSCIGQKVYFGYQETKAIGEKYKLIGADNGGYFFCRGDSVFLVKHAFTKPDSFNTQFLFTNKIIAESTNKVVCLDYQAIIFSTESNGIFVAKRCDVTKAFPKDNSQHYQLIQSPENEKLYSVKTKEVYNLGENNYSRSYQYHVDCNYIYKDKNDYFWQVEYLNDVSYVYRTSTDSIKGEFVGSLKGVVSYIFESDAGCLWLLGNSEIAYWKNELLQKKGRLTIGSSTRVTSSVFKNDSLLIATTSGLFLYDTSDYYLKEFDEFKGHELRDIKPLSDSTYLVATYGDGVFYYSGNTFIKIPSDKEGMLNFTHEIIFINDTTVLFLTNRGLLYTNAAFFNNRTFSNKQQILYYYLSENYANLGIEYNGGINPLTVIDNSGKLFIPSNNGIRVINTNDIAPYYTHSKAFITGVKLDGKSISIDSAITIPAKIDIIRIVFCIPYWGADLNLDCEYSLVNLDHTSDTIWQSTNMQSISFYDIEAGNYQLVIRNRVGINENAYVYSSLKFSKVPFWYDTVWFKLLLTLSFVIILLSYFYYKKIKVEKSNKILKEEIKEATAELRYRNSINNKLLHAISHDISGNIHSTSFVLRTLELQSSVPVIKDVISTLDGLETYIDSLTYWMTADREYFKIANENINLYHLIYNLVWKYIQGSVKQRIDLSGIDRELVVSSNYKILEIILYNIISNSVKYAGNESINIFTAIDGSVLKIIVKDNGPGFPSNTLKWLQVQNSEKSKRAKMQLDTSNYKRGLGLSIVIDLISLLNATVTFANNRDKSGAIVIIRLNL